MRVETAYIMSSLICFAAPSMAQDVPQPPPGEAGPATIAENTANACRDRRDNDGDGHVDCDDQDCEVFVFCVSPPPGQTPQVAPQPAPPSAPVQPAPSPPSAQPAVPAPSVQSAPTGRRIHVRAEPTGAGVLLDVQPGRGPIERFSTNWQTAPTTFETTTGLHTIILDDRGHERLSVPVPAGYNECILEGWDYCNDYDPGAMFGTAFSTIGVPGLSFLTAGILMTVLDRNRRGRYEVTEVARSE